MWLSNLQGSSVTLFNYLLNTLTTLPKVMHQAQAHGSSSDGAEYTEGRCLEPTARDRLTTSILTRNEVSQHCPTAPEEWGPARYQTVTKLRNKPQPTGGWGQLDQPFFFSLWHSLGPIRSNTGSAKLTRGYSRMNQRSKYKTNSKCFTRHSVEVHA